MVRFAIYFVPSSGSRLGVLGSRWLGWDADANAASVQPDVPKFSADRIATVTETARRYCWHATLKAPFVLAAGRSLDELKQAMRAFTHVHESLSLPQLRVGTLNGFIALVPQTDAHGLGTFAMEVVRAFDRFRAPLDAAEIAKRRKAGLTARQEALLLHWGYPYVMDEYRFHLTLAGPVTDGERDALFPFLESWFAPAVNKPELMADIALCEQPSEDQQFRLVERFAFGR